MCDELPKSTLFLAYTTSIGEFLIDSMKILFNPTAVICMISNFFVIQMMPKFSFAVDVLHYSPFKENLRIEILQHGYWQNSVNQFLKLINFILLDLEPRCLGSIKPVINLLKPG